MSYHAMQCKQLKIHDNPEFKSHSQFMIIILGLYRVYQKEVYTWKIVSKFKPLSLSTAISFSMRVLWTKASIEMKFVNSE